MEVNLASIEDKIAAVAFDLFRKWTALAKDTYPSYSLVISDERVLVSDLRRSIEESITALFRKSHNKDRTKPGWSIGFVYGFVKGKLNLHWYYEYILKQQDDYKAIMVLKAIQHYLKIEELATIQIYDFYEELLSKDINLDELQTAIKKYNVNFKRIEYDVSEDHADRIELLDTCLENLIIEKTFGIIKKETPSFMPDLGIYYDEDEIEELIEMNDPY